MSEDEDGISDTYVNKEFEESEIGGAVLADHGDIPAMDATPVVGRERKEIRSRNYFLGKVKGILESWKQIK